MIFPGIENQIVELKIAGYQFPKAIIKNDYDSNWLNIQLEVKSFIGNWKSEDPSILTWEMENLINWFEDLGNNFIEEKTVEFIEPNLSFELIFSDEDLKQIRIKFDLESRPKFAKDNTDYFVDCLLFNSEVIELSKSLKKDLDKYPKR